MRKDNSTSLCYLNLDEIISFFLFKRERKIPNHKSEKKLTWENKVKRRNDKLLYQTLHKNKTLITRIAQTICRGILRLTEKLGEVDDTGICLFFFFRF